VKLAGIGFSVYGYSKLIIVSYQYSQQFFNIKINRNMPQANFTDIEEMMILIAYKTGLKIGQDISRAIESGELVVPDNETLEVLITSLYTYKYPMYQKILAKIGSPEFSTAGNIGLAAGGLCLAGISTQNYFETKNPVARVCYAASILCSSTAKLLFQLV
jgi:hypothetical protein